MENQEKDMLPRSNDNLLSDKENQNAAGSASEQKVFYYEAPMSVWLYLAALIGVFIVANLIGGAVSLLLKSTNIDPGFATFCSYVISIGLTIIFALWQAKRRGLSKPLLRFSFRKSNPALILWGFILVLVISIVLEPLVDLFPSRYLEFLKESIGTGAWAMLTTVVAAPILEEILFRGLVQESLTRQFGAWKSILLAAAVFGIVHLIPQQIVNAFFIGIVLGYIYVRTRSLVPVILIHAINNALAFIIMEVFGADAMVSTREIIGSDPIYWILYAICCVILVAASMNLWSQLGKITAAAESGSEKK